MPKVLAAILVGFSFLFGPVLGSAQSSPQYEITNLIKAHDVENELRGVGAYMISDQSVVVGFTGQSPTQSSPFYTVDGKATRLKGGGEFGATAGDINSAGVIVGRAFPGAQKITAVSLACR